MKRKISNQFLVNYFFMFILSIVIALFSFLLMDFANHVISKNLVKNNYKAESIMQDDYQQINSSLVTKNGGGVQVINKQYEVVFTAGMNTFKKNKLTTAEFTDFLISSKSIGIPYSYNIQYNEKEQFWLIVTFPTSLRLGLDIGYNKDYSSVDKQDVIGVLVAIVLFYLLMLAITTFIFSKFASIGIIGPLRKLSTSVRSLRDGDYSARVDLNLKNEFGELQDTFNAMAQQIEKEISLREKSEINRKELILGISHDLKNPLSSILGYAELCRKSPGMSKDEQDAYLKIILDNGERANNLITNLFELSKLESSEFILAKVRTDICEYTREIIGKALPILDDAGFNYEIDIPEVEIFTMLDLDQMNRAFQNLISNSVRYNPRGTKLYIGLSVQHDKINIIFKDNGTGIPASLAENIFQPFIRADSSRNSKTGGTGLGLAIVEKIVSAHGGSILLKTDLNQGCEFIITLPKV